MILKSNEEIFFGGTEGRISRVNMCPDTSASISFAQSGSSLPE